MKWLATTFLCLLTTTAALADKINTQQDIPGVTMLPVPTPCGNIPLDETYLEKYGELRFLEGDAQIFAGPGQVINGVMRIFVNPDTKTFTIVLDIDGKLYCMLTSGKDLRAAMSGEPI